MKKIATLLTLASLCLGNPAHAEGWFDSIKNMLGFGAEEQAQPQPSTAEMVKSLTSGLGVTSAQAEGGLGSIFNYVKGNVSAEQFQKLSGALPGLDQVLKAVPEVSSESVGGLSGLIDKAAEYSESLKAINDVKKQFEALGLKPEMIASYVEQAKAYLDTEQGQEAKKMLTEGLGKLLG